MAGFVKLIFVALLALTSVPANSDEFDDAVALWLNGDDPNALTGLARLAQKADPRARILLARLETLDRGPSAWRLALDPNEARNLFRKAGRGLAKSWLAIEADNGNALAIALRESRFATLNRELINRLVEMGEFEATDYPTRFLALNGTSEMRQALLESDVLLPDLRPYLLYLQQNPEPRGDGLHALRHILGQPQLSIDDDGARAMAGLLALGYGFDDVTPDNPFYASVATWVMSHPSTRPIADLCRTECPSEPQGCGFALMALSGGYFEVIRLDSPVETYIPQADFLSSPRARIMALRRAALARSETAGLLASVAEVAEMNACAAKLVENQRNAKP